MLPPRLRPTVFSLSLISISLVSSTGLAQFYWDTNGATAGSGNAGGSWNTGTNWSTDAAGTIGTIGWVDGNQARFSAGTDGTGSLVIGITGTVNPAGVVVEEGQIFTSGNINSTGSILIQRGMGPTSLTLGGSGMTTTTFVGIGNPLAIGGQTGTATLLVQDSHYLDVNGNLFLGEQAGNAGNVVQSGGQIDVSGQIRVGHWSNELSTYNMTAGTLNSNGGLFVGWDGNGEMNVGGTSIVNATAETTIWRDSNLTIDGNALFTTNTFRIGDGPRGNGTLNIGGNATVNAGTVTIGDASGFAGTVNQSGGNFNVSQSFLLGHWPNETSIYNLSGGTLNLTGTANTEEGAGTLTVGIDGTGDFNQTGGNIIAHRLHVNARTNGQGGVSTYDLEGGTLSLRSGGVTANVSGGSSYQINLGGGTVQALDDFTFAANATLTGLNGWTNFDTNGNDILVSGNLTGGGGIVKRGDGTLTFTGNNDFGNVRVQRDGGNSTVVFDGGGTSSMNYLGIGNPLNIGGQTGTATVVINDHTLNINGNFFLGERSGSAGNVDQNGGSVTVTGGLRVGHWPNEVSTYDMAGGTLTLTGTSNTEEGNGTLTVGVDGTGDFNHTGGTVTAHRLHLNSRTNGQGGTSTYDLEGGVLQLRSGGITGNISGSSNYQLNLGGGTVRALENFAINIDAALTNVNGATEFDTNGNTITVNGNLLGGGDLNKRGDGTLILNGSNTLGGLRVQRDTGNSTVIFDGGGTSSATYIGVGNPLNIGGQTGVATVVVNNHNLNVNGNLMLGERPGNGGNFVQNGGQVAVSGDIRVGHWPSETSTYNMTGGTLTSNGGLYVGWDGQGLMNVTGGTVNANGDLFIQRNSTLTVGGAGQLNANVIQVGQSRGNGTLAVQGNGVVNATRLDVGNPAGVSGAVEQSGGTINLTGGGGLPALRLGHWPNETSTYNMTGGTLNAIGSSLFVGWDGNGQFTMSGNSQINTDQLRIGSAGGSTFTLNGGEINIANYLGLGERAANRPGTFVQNGGTVNVNGGEVRIGHYPGTPSGTYLMTGGTLNTQAADLYVGWDGSQSLLDVAGNANVIAGNVVIQRDAKLNVRNNATFSANIFRVGDSRQNGTLSISDNAQVLTNILSVGDDSGDSGIVNQTGGSFEITQLGLIGHWPNELSNYNLSGGSLMLTGTPTGNVTVQPEANGVLYIGVDGTGVFTQTGGMAMADGIVLDARGETAGTDTFTLNGGTFGIGATGIQSGSNNTNTTFQINLGGGTLQAKTDWQSTLPMTLTGTGGNITFDTAGNNILLTGNLSGNGGLVKAGAGTQTVSGTNSYGGTTTVAQGTLLVDGSHTGAGAYDIQSGSTLGGNGNIGLSGAPVTVASGAFISPGSGYSGTSPASVADVGTFGISSPGTALVMDGTLLMDIASLTEFDVLDLGGELIINSGAIMEINGETDYTHLDFDVLGLDQLYSRIDLVTADSIVGDFDNFPANMEIRDAAGNYIFFGNDGTSLFIQNVPEPTAVLIWALLGGLAVAWRRRKSLK